MQRIRAVLFAAVGPDADAALELDARGLHLPLATSTFLSAVEWTSARPRKLQDDRAPWPMLGLGAVVHALAEVAQPARAVMLSAVLMVAAQHEADLLEVVVVTG